MSGCLLSPSQQVRYKNSKDAENEDQDEEILISSLSEDETNSGEEANKVPRLKTFLFVSNIFTVLLILFVASGTLYYCTDIFRSSHRGSCLHLQQVNEVVVEVEITDFKSCSDNKTCHLFLDVIEKKHEGLKYNFVIGQKGELYIGAGFKCLVNSDKNALYVKFLRSELEEVHAKACDRFTDIIKHGILCNIISPNFNLENETNECPLDQNVNPFNHYSMSKYPVIHDPGHDTKLIDGNFQWTSCGSLATLENVKKGKVITLECWQNNSCSPLQLVDEVMVDIEEAPRFSCNSRSTCLQEYEENHDGLKYNFIISHNKDIYIGLGFKCNADTTSNNTLRIKVLRELETSHSVYNDTSQLVKYLLILEEGIGCGKISDRFSVKVNYNHLHIDDPEQNYMSYTDRDVIKRYLMERFPDLYMDDATIYSEERDIVWDGFRYRICQRKQSHNTTSPTYVSSSDITTTTDHTAITPEKCIPYKKVDKVRVVTETAHYYQNNSLNRPSLLNIIEKDHDGLKFNFVIGPKGELYIGTGFNCVANSEENALLVKLLLPTTESEFFQSIDVACFRLQEIIEHGIKCEKISKTYTNISEFATDHVNIWLDDLIKHMNISKPDPELVSQKILKVCLSFKPKRLSDHLHDPNYMLRTINPDSYKWTSCGNFPIKTTKEINKEKLLNVSRGPCSPLQHVDQVLVDFQCSDISLDHLDSCLQAIETPHNGYDYNFIIGQGHVCAGSGFHCKAKNTSSNVFKILASKEPFDSLFPTKFFQHPEFLQVIAAAIACGSITRNFKLQLNFTECNVDDCKGIREEQWKIDDEENIVTISEVIRCDYRARKRYKHSRRFKYQLCPYATYGEMVKFPPEIAAPVQKEPDFNDRWGVPLDSD